MKAVMLLFFSSSCRSLFESESFSKKQAATQRSGESGSEAQDPEGSGTHSGHVGEGAAVTDAPLGSVKPCVTTVTQTCKP